MEENKKTEKPKQNFTKDWIFLGTIIVLLIYNWASGNSVSAEVKYMLLTVYCMLYIYFGIDNNW